MFVLDSSVAMAWCFEDEATEATDAVLDRLRDDRALVPRSGRWRSRKFCSLPSDEAA